MNSNKCCKLLFVVLFTTILMAKVSLGTVHTTLEVSESYNLEGKGSIVERTWLKEVRDEVHGFGSQNYSHDFSIYDDQTDFVSNYNTEGTGTYGISINSKTKQIQQNAKLKNAENISTRSVVELNDKWAKTHIISSGNGSLKTLLMGVSENNKNHPKDLSRIYACGDVNYDVYMRKSAPYIENWLGFCGHWADEAFFGAYLEDKRAYL